MDKKLTKLIVFFAIIFPFSGNVFSQIQENQTKPVAIQPGKGNTPPSDAIILFNGGDLNKFTGVKENTPVLWNKRGSGFTVVPNTGNIQSKQNFSDIQLHIEFKIPRSAIKNEGQKSGNSGIYLMGKYEIQVLNSYEKETSPYGQAGAIYGQYPPLVNASLKPGKWQEYDIIFMAPEYNKNGELKNPPYLTVFHNGILIHNHVEVKGPTAAHNSDLPENSDSGPLMLQDHNNKVSYRNIWIREL
jgi:hypothetical protein